MGADESPCDSKRLWSLWFCYGSEPIIIPFADLNQNYNLEEIVKQLHSDMSAIEYINVDDDIQL